MAIARPMRRRFWPMRREVEDPFFAMRRQMDRMFEDVSRRFWGESMERVSFVPDVDVVESDKEIKVSAELPGMDQKDLEISIRGDNLVIKGEKKQEREERGENYYCAERSYGSFTREIPLPAAVDRDKVDAKFKNGVLSITLQKRPEAIEETKRIQVSAS